MTRLRIINYNPMHTSHTTAFLVKHGTQSAKAECMLIHLNNFVRSTLQFRLHLGLVIDEFLEGKDSDLFQNSILHEFLNFLAFIRNN